MRAVVPLAVFFLLMFVIMGENLAIIASLLMVWVEVDDAMFFCKLKV